MFFHKFFFLLTFEVNKFSPQNLTTAGVLQLHNCHLQCYKLCSNKYRFWHPAACLSRHTLHSSIEILNLKIINFNWPDLWKDYVQLLTFIFQKVIGFQIFKIFHFEKLTIDLNSENLFKLREAFKNKNR